MLNFLTLFSLYGPIHILQTRYVVVARRSADPTAEGGEVVSQVYDPLGLAPISPTLQPHLPSHYHTRCKASIALTIRNIPGSLFKTTSCFALRGVNIIKIESRPSSVLLLPTPISKTALTLRKQQGSITYSTPVSSVGTPAPCKHWEQLYFIDYEPSEHSAVNSALLNNLSEFCLWVQELGYYHANLQQVDTVSAEWRWRDVLDVVAN